MNIKKAFLYITLLLTFTLSLIFTSCSSPVNEDITEYKDLTLTLVPSREGTDPFEGNNLIFKVTALNTETLYTKEVEGNANSPIVLKQLPDGPYEIYVYAEDEKYIYEGKSIIGILGADNRSTIVDITFREKGGQISLIFDNITFDQNAFLNVSVLFKGNELFTKKGIKTSDIERNKYVIPIYLPEENYTVKITGGNVDKEKYIVNEDKEISVKLSLLNEVHVTSYPYKTVYVSSKTSSSGEKGTLDSPFSSIQKALDFLKDCTDPINIIIDGSVTNRDGAIVLEKGKNITISGINNGTVLHNGGELIINNGSDLTFNNISLLSNEEKGETLSFNSGNITFLDNVYIKHIKVSGNNKINVYGNLKNDSSHITNFTLSSYTEGEKILSLFFSSTFDNSFITLTDPTFRVNERGEIERKKSNITITEIKNIDETNSGKINKDFSYKVMYKNEEVVPLTPISIVDNTLSSPIVIKNLKNGLTYDIVFYYKNTSLPENDISGTKDNTKGVMKTFSVTHLVSNIASNNTISVTLSSPKVISQSIILTTPDLTSTFDYPLTLRLKGNKGKEIKHTITGFPTHINYLLPDTYTCSVTSDTHLYDYTMDKEINLVIDEAKVNSYTVEGKAFSEVQSAYYIKNNPTSTNNGTKENPFTSLSAAINALKTKNKPLYFIVSGEITESEKINLTEGLDITVIGQDNANIVANNGLLTMTNYKTKVAFKNITISSPSLLEGEVNNIIEANYGTLDLSHSVTFDTGTGALRCVLSYTKEASVKISNSLLTNDNGYIYLKKNALLNLYDIRTNPLKVKIEEPSYGSGVLYNANKDNTNITEKSYKNVAYVNNEYSIDKYGFLAPYGFVTPNDVLEISSNYTPSATPLDLKVFVQGTSDLYKIGKVIRSFPPNSVALTIKPASNIKKIDKFSFNYDDKGCNTITSLTLCEGFTAIDENSFRNCNNLKTISLPQSLLEIYANAFATQAKEEKDKIPTVININTKTLKVFYANIFKGRTIDPSSKGIKEVYPFSFGSEWEVNCSLEELLTNKTLMGFNPDNYINKIYTVDEAIAFIEKNYDPGVTVSIPTIDDLNRLTACIRNFNGGNLYLTISHLNTNITSIPSNTFSGCSKLKSLSLPISIKEIESNAFTDCPLLSSVYLQNYSIVEGFTLGNKVESYYSSPYKFVTSSGTHEIKKYQAASDLATELKETYATSKWYSPYNIDDIESLVKTSTTDKDIWAILKNEDLPRLKSALQSFTHNLALDLTKSDLIVELPDNEFTSLTNLTSITLPSTLIIIGKSCFSGCTGLTTVKIPSTVREIKEGAFYNTGLVTAEFEDTSSTLESFDTVNYIRKLFTQNDTALNAAELKKEGMRITKFVDVPTAIQLVKDSYNKYREVQKTQLLDLCVITNSLAELNELGDKITVTGQQHIPSKDNRGISYVQYDLSLIMNGSDNTSITHQFQDRNEVGYPSNVYNPGYEETSMYRFTLHSPNIEIGHLAFSLNTELEKVLFPDSTIVRGGAFNRCYSLQSSSCVTVDENRFVILPKTPNVINSYARDTHSYDLGIDTLVIPSTFTEISSHAFVNCYRIKTIDLGNIEKVGDYAFNGADHLENIIFSKNPLFTTLSTGMAYKTALGVNDKAVNIPSNITTIMPGALKSNPYINMHSKSSVFVFEDSTATWENEDKTKTFTAGQSYYEKENFVNFVVLAAPDDFSTPTFTKKVGP